MKKNRLLNIAGILLYSIAFAQCGQQQDIYSFTYNGKKYEIVKEKKNWANAAACAVQRGGYLVQINDSSEQNAVYKAIVASGISSTYTTVNDGGGIACVWIGATDHQQEGKWLWDGNNDGQGDNFWNGQGKAGNSDGSAVNDAYTNWGGSQNGTCNEPDNYNDQDAAAIGLSKWPYGIAGEWNDIAMNNKLFFVIEYDNTGGK